MQQTQPDPLQRKGSNLSGTGSQGTPPIQWVDDMGSASDQMFFVTSYRYVLLETQCIVTGPYKKGNRLT
jgi:hypothetical protein